MKAGEAGCIMSKAEKWMTECDLRRRGAVGELGDFALKSNQGQRQVSTEVRGAPRILKLFVSMSVPAGITAQARYYAAYSA